jgi:hypothetical protein
LGEAKKNDHHFAGKVLQRSQLTMLIRQAETFGIVRTGKVYPLETGFVWTAGRQQTARQKQEARGQYRNTALGNAWK